MSKKIQFDLNPLITDDYLNHKVKVDNVSDANELCKKICENVFISDVNSMTNNVDIEDEQIVPVNQKIQKLKDKGKLNTNSVIQ